MCMYTAEVTRAAPYQVARKHLPYSSPGIEGKHAELSALVDIHPSLPVSACSSTSPSGAIDFGRELVPALKHPKTTNTSHLFLNTHIAFEHTIHRNNNSPSLLYPPLRKTYIPTYLTHPSPPIHPPTESMTSSDPSNPATLFPSTLISPTVTAALPSGYTLRPLQRNDFHAGFLDVLRVLTHVGDVTQAEFEAQFDQMKGAAGGYHILVILDGEEKIVGTGALVVERKLYVCLFFAFALVLFPWRSCFFGLVGD